MSAVQVAPRTREAAILAEMANDLNDTSGSTAGRLRRRGFWRMASAPGCVHSAMTSSWRRRARRGVGNALMAAVAAETVRGGGASLEWGAQGQHGRARVSTAAWARSARRCGSWAFAGERLRALAAGAP